MSFRQRPWEGEAVFCDVLRPVVLEGLEALRGAGWTLGTAMNGAVDIQLAKLDTTGLAPLLDGVSISEGVGARKPECAHFDAVAAACGVPLSAGGWLVGPPPRLVNGVRADLLDHVDGVLDDAAALVAVERLV